MKQWEIEANEILAKLDKPADSYAVMAVQDVMREAAVKMIEYFEESTEHGIPPHGWLLDALNALVGVRDAFAAFVAKSESDKLRAGLANAIKGALIDAIYKIKFDCDTVFENEGGK